MRSNPESRSAPAWSHGPDGVASSAPVIDGLQPVDVVAPDTSKAVADLLADAADRRLAVTPFGGGTALAVGNPPERLDLALSTARLGGIVAYEPTDLVLSVGAGARFGDVRAVLAEHGQCLPLDAPDEATIGGRIATALAGPRRLGSGTLRDLLIGIAVAHPSGTITNAGGMVVKNVTGFDLTRVYHGSLGTLGVILSANFKVLPLPRYEATVIARCDDAEEAMAGAARIRDGLAPIALEVTHVEGGWLIAVRLEGREATVRAQTDTARSLLRDADIDDAESIDGAECSEWWERYVAGQSPKSISNDVLIRCAVRPRATTELLRLLLDREARGVVAFHTMQVSPGLGLIHTRLSGSNDGGGPEWLSSTQTDLLALCDNVAILAAPSEWKRGLDVWGRTPKTLDVMRALKEQFDPNRVLNPGRYAGFI